MAKKKLCFTTNQKNGMRIKILSGESSLQALPGGRVKSIQTRTPVYLDLVQDKECFPAEAAKTLTEKFGFEVTEKQVSERLVEHEKKSPALLYWENRNVPKTQKDLEVRVEDLQAENAEQKRKMAELQRQLAESKKPQMQK